ncbi:MAG: DinB family protein [Candidatus Eisenbacteria bacterium]|uniref:DinB family protein n=1 Tax=Eiseniibacteriota bacterium TaxID=2212470 RepID=A0A933SDU1_UNCEI|nr:DinB family protein [Candidatus Eisenbacteria bacterium]
MPLYTLPAADEYALYYGKYIDRVGPDPLAALVAQAASTAALLAATPESLASHRYAEGKWTVREVVVHLSDAERVFAYRALRVGRGDGTPLPGFDENLFAANCGAERRTLADVAAEFAAVRAASLALFRSFDAEAIGRRGTASGHPVTVRSLVAMIAGHELHHVALLRERYGLGG